MARFPIAERRVQSAPLSPPKQPMPGDSGNGALARGLGQLGGAVENVGQDVLEAAAKDRQRAEAVAASDAENALQAAITEEFYDDARGALHKRGREALPAVDGAYANIAKRRDEISKGLSERSRAVFESRASDILTGARRTGEGHAATQTRAAEADTIEAAQAGAIDALARNPYDKDEINLQRARVLPRVRAFALSPEAAAQAEAQFEKVAATTRLNRMLDDGDDESAAVLFAKAKDALGPDGRRFEREIKTLKRTKDADRAVSAVVAYARDDETGWVDEAAALRAFEATAVDDPRTKDAAQDRLREALSEAARVKTKDIDGRFTEAFTAYNQGGIRAIPARTADWLNTHAPEKWAFFKKDAERRWRQSRSDGAEARREQAAIDKEALYDFRAKEAATKPEADVVAEYGPAGVSPAGLKVIEAEKRKAIDSVAKGYATDEGEFVRSALAKAPAKVQGNEKKSKALKAAAVREFNAYVEQHKRPPPADVANKLVDESLLNSISVEGLIFDSKKLGFEAPTKRDRAKALKTEGLSNADIAAKLTEEGY